MHNRFLHRSLYILLFFANLTSLPHALAQGYSYTDPAPKGVPVTSIVQIGPMNTTNFDVTITLLETVRSKQALERLQTASADIKAAKAGYEYLLARIRFALQGRAVSDIGVFELGDSPFQWIAYSSDLRQYESAAVTPPKPALQGPARSGEAVEGWVVFAVEQKEREPMMAFDPSSGGAIGRGNILFFELY